MKTNLLDLDDSTLDPGPQLLSADVTITRRSLHARWVLDGPIPKQRNGRVRSLLWLSIGLSESDAAFVPVGDPNASKVLLISAFPQRESASAVLAPQARRIKGARVTVQAGDGQQTIVELTARRERLPRFPTVMGMNASARTDTSRGDELVLSSSSCPSRGPGFFVPFPN